MGRNKIRSIIIVIIEMIMVKYKWVLILGGIGDSLKLIFLVFIILGLEVISFFVGCISKLVMFFKCIWIGGFGGVFGLKDYLRE